jgi:hypothetical protein
VGTFVVVLMAEGEKRAARRVAPQRAPATEQEGAPAGASHEGGVEATRAPGAEEDAAGEKGGEKLENSATAAATREEEAEAVSTARPVATRSWTTFCDVLLVYGSQWRKAFGRASWLMMGA